MKLKNYEIANANYALNEMANEKIRGKFKFKLFKVKAELERSLEVTQKALEGVEDKEEQQEILKEEQDLDIDLFTEDELVDLPLSMKQLSMLKPIMKER